MEEYKVCNICRVSKPISEYYKRRASGAIIAGCKTCRAIAGNKWKREHPQKVKAQKREYDTGWKAEEFELALAKQWGCCAICRCVLTVASNKRNTAHADHCHKTKKKRGILCAVCNKALGCFRDSTALLKSAVEYLELN